MLASHVEPLLPSSLLFLPSLDQLGRIIDPSVNACVVTRSLASAERAALEALSREHVDRDLEIGPETDVLDLLWGLPSGAHSVLAMDLPVLVDSFLALTGHRSARAKLQTVSCDACRKFHVDYVGIRMLVTYAGPGTEIAENQNVRRQHIGRSDLAPDEANTAVVPDSSRVVRARAGDVVVLKGEAFHQNAGNGGVHRSPPIEVSGERRLLLKIDLPGCGC